MGCSSVTIRYMADQKLSAPGPKTDAWQRALEYGIDTERTKFLLALSPAERLRRHDIVRPLILAARQAGVRLYGFDPRLTGTTE
jgi:hypothetical protein